MYCLLAVFLLLSPILAQIRSKCSGLGWEYDEKLNMCLAKHCGKAGNGETILSDFHACNARRMLDAFSCGGGFENQATCQHPLPRPPPPPGTPAKPTIIAPLCPAGQTCVWGPFGFGFCCEEKNEAVWHNEYDAKCASPLKTVKIEQKGVTDEILRGKKCADFFCPKGSKCIQGKYIAHCCA
ncbi:hypothetical protein PFISCL1PPCAC_3271 [Pristionchus fissidentatus]|uniref:Uncharacterized protein n=1 Tax=Pristionchus fissidentatus TaxID=1538716 RepID=A0AAV5UXX5_9BILA|nr:hypothetical protein PFISCL1PPCAC_3271 [Pristionchus fissidentatus]